MGMENVNAANGGGGANAKITASVVFICLTAALSGLMFGYEVGISGGVTTMLPFLKQFFPSVLKSATSAKTDTYCLYNDQLLTFFTSSISLSGVLAALVGSRLTKMIGLRNMILSGGFLFLVGAALTASATSIAVLVIGRIFLGVGVSFTNMTTPVYISEMAPPKWRGSFLTASLYYYSIGNVSASVINYFVAKLSWGWRFSLGFCAVPATIMTVGVLFIPDTPTSLVERGYLGEAHTTLIKIKGPDRDVGEELSDLTKSSEVSKAIQGGSCMTILERQYRPHLVMAIALPFFSQITGINIIGFYAPPIFRAVGYGSESALMATIVLGIVGFCATIISTLTVDRCGRRLLFITGGVIMFVCQLLVAGLLLVTMGLSGDKTMPKGYPKLVLALLCLFCVAFNMSWGGLTFLVMSEIFPVRIRSTGQSICVAVMAITIFTLSQSFTSMLCHLKFGTFLFHAVWLVVMTTFVTFFLPETKGIPLNSMHQIWEQHWYWSRFVQPQM